MKSIEKGNAARAASDESGKCKQSGADKGPLKVSTITREASLTLLKKYNQERFHIQHGLTVEGVMRRFAKKLGYGEEELWGLCGLLHYIDFEMWPDELLEKTMKAMQSCEEKVAEEMNKYMPN